MTDLALTLLRIFEGFRPRVYSDVAGYGTIGYGHLVLPGEDWSGGITVQEGERLLVSDFSKHRTELKTLTSGIELVEHEEEALTSFVFNLGVTRFRGSTLLLLLRDWNRTKDPVTKRRVSWEFLKWRNAGGRPQPGLVKRRHIESIWFLGAAPETLLDFARK